MQPDSRSLIDFIDAPILVGDPDGRAVYVNPCFEREFQTSKDSVTGVPLASLFEGGGREAVLSSVARVCSGDAVARFRLREGGRGYVALASPVEADGGRVGVVILLTHEPDGEERVSALRRDVVEPLDEVAQCFADLMRADGDADRQRLLVADGIRAIERMRKWAQDRE